MEFENVCQRFLLYTGLDAAEGEAWFLLCEDAMREVNRRLIAGVSTEGREADLENVAAAKAFYRWTLYFVSDGGADRISVGDLSMAGDPHTLTNSALEILKIALQQVADLVESDDFAFIKTDTTWD